MKRVQDKQSAVQGKCIMEKATHKKSATWKKCNIKIVQHKQSTDRENFFKKGILKYY